MTTWQDRFWSKVDRKGPDDCWNWLAGNFRGYGQFHLNGKTWRAHRLSLVIAGHTLDDDQVVWRLA